jgi:hypothetical protein
MSNNQGGSVNLRNDICHGKGLSRARYTEQKLCAVPCIQTVYQFSDCLGLIAHRLVNRGEFKVHIGEFGTRYAELIWLKKQRNADKVKKDNYICAYTSVF